MSLKVTKMDVWSGEIQDQREDWRAFSDGSPRRTRISRWSWPVGSRTSRVLGSSFSRQ
jgi:hypothetical protein